MANIFLLNLRIAQNKDLYYHALAESQTGWHEGTENVLPFIKYILGTILAAYKDFEDRVALVETKLSSLERYGVPAKIKSDVLPNRIFANSVLHSVTVPSKVPYASWLRAGELKKRRGSGKKHVLFRLN